MSRKSRGINAERELLHKFWDNGFIAMRAPASGAIKYPCPDLLVGNAARKLAIECKTTSSEKQYLSSDQVESLKMFADIFGAEPWIAVRFNMRKDNAGWYFVSLDDLKDTAGKNYVVSLALAKARGMLFEEIIK
ncbi:Holliday junction resolvase [Candidatus Woesearchaeota archaeon]|nr:Holliday junction resolvase [Candidatus Woesearchaeota archaeon]